MAGQLLYIKSNKKLYKKDNEYYTPKRIVKYFENVKLDRIELIIEDKER